jgi:hypothetical protein
MFTGVIEELTSLLRMHGFAVSVRSFVNLDHLRRPREIAVLKPS